MKHKAFEENAQHFPQLSVSVQGIWHMPGPTRCRVVLACSSGLFFPRHVTKPPEEILLKPMTMSGGKRELAQMISASVWRGAK